MNFNFFLNKSNNITLSEKISIIDTEYQINNDIKLKQISLLFSLINISSSNIVNINKDFYHNICYKNIFKNILTGFGEIVLDKYLNTPTYNVDLLLIRQNNIKYLYNKNIDEILINIKKNENEILWFWNNDVNSDNFNSLYELLFYNIPYLNSNINSMINKNDLLLNITHIYKIFISPMITFFIPILTFLIPLIFFYIFKINITFTLFKNTMLFALKTIILNIIPKTTGKLKFLSIFIAGIYLFLYLRTSYDSIKNAYDINKIINIFHKKLNYIAELIINISQLNILLPNFKSSVLIDNDLDFFNKHICPIYYNPQLFTNKGKILSTYQIFLENKDKLKNILFYLGEIDMFYSLTKLKNISLSIFDTISKKPYIKINKIWHPSIIKDPIKNSLNIDKNILITGPNQAGKSTFIKSVAINLLYSQTLGIVTAKKFLFTPFHIINSYINISDNIGKESLFDAEISRSKEYIDLIKNNVDKKSFIVIDEILTSTNYIEGYSAAYAIIKNIAKYTNNISIITTHYTNFVNINNLKYYKFISKKIDNNIVYPYKIYKGYSKQYIALELLKKKFNDLELINDAMEIQTKFKSLHP